MVAAVVVAAAVVASATSAGFSFSARIKSPPTVQRTGAPYFLTVIVTNRGGAIRPFCLDFGDDHNSWLFRMPGLSSWDSDTFCTALRARSRRNLTAVITPARTGNRKLSVTLGKATLYRTLHNAVITDDHALSWSDQFVIVS